jgi:hypothetical protein
MSLTRGTVSPVPTRELSADARRALRRAAARHADQGSTKSLADRNAEIVRWHKELGRGWLSAIAREAHVSRVQAQRIVKAASETAPGQPIPPTRRYYQ